MKALCFCTVFMISQHCDNAVTTPLQVWVGKIQLLAIVGQDRRSIHL